MMVTIALTISGSEARGLASDILLHHEIDAWEGKEKPACPFLPIARHEREKERQDLLDQYHSPLGCVSLKLLSIALSCHILQILASCKSKTALNLSYFQVFDSIQGGGEIRLDRSPSAQHQKTGGQVAGDDFFVVSNVQQSTHAGYSSKLFDLIA
jgi:hypothetical protein